MTTPSKLIIPVVALSLLLVTALLRAQPNSAGEQPGRYQLVSATYGDYHTPEYSKPIGDGTKGTRRPYVEEMLLRPEYQTKITEAIRFNTDYSNITTLSAMDSANDPLRLRSRHSCPST